MKVVYVIWLESLDHPIIKAQVLDVCEMIAQNGASLHILYFSMPRLVEKSKQILKETLPTGATFQVAPVWFAKYHFRRLNWIFLNPAQAIVARYFIKRTLKRLPADIDIFHFRSYPSATTIPWLSKSRPKSGTVFDPRSPYPDELVTLGICKRNSTQHQFWNQKESEIIQHASVTVATTSTFAKSLTERAQVDINKTKVIPNNVSLNRFKITANARITAREELGIKDEIVTFGYVGSLGLTSWNNPLVYIGFLKQLLQSGIDFCVLFITNKSDGLVLRQALTEENVDSRYFRIHSAPFEKVPYYMSAIDLSLNLMVKRDPRLSIKTAEYLAAGLPVIANRKAEGVANLIQEHSLGIIIKDEQNLSKADLEAITQLIENKEKYASRAAEYVQNYCSTQAVSAAYLNLYSDLNKDTL